MKLKQILKRAVKYVLYGTPNTIINVNNITLNQSNLLDGRTALITGGTSGIGYAISRAFLLAGANVIITGRSQHKVNSACDKLKIETKNSKVAGIELDNQNVESFKEKIKHASSFFGKIDILVNNAGVLTHNTVGNENLKKYDEVLNTNLRGPFFLCQVIGHYMKDNKIRGNILNIGSSSCFRPASTAYTLSKWGIRGVTLGLARMLAPYGITVNGLAPGVTLTGMVAEADKKKNLYFPYTPLGRYILPEEIANMAVVLVSDMGKSVMGDIVCMTGGSGILTYEDMNYDFI